MGIEIADGAVHFRQKSDVFNRFDDAIQSHGKNSKFLSDCGRRGGLPVGAREHGNVGPAMRVVLQNRVNRAEFSDKGFATVRKHHRVARVIDIFACAGKVHEFAFGG